MMKKWALLLWKEIKNLWEKFTSESFLQGLLIFLLVVLAALFLEALEPHIDQPVSHELPEDSGAITGAYTEEEAEKWIAEYEAAMSEIPTGSDDCRRYLAQPRGEKRQQKGRASVVDGAHRSRLRLYSPA